MFNYNDYCEYTCRFEYNVVMIVIAELTSTPKLLSDAPNEITKPLSDVTLTEAPADFELHCETLKPVRSVQWTKNGQRLVEGRKIKLQDGRTKQTLSIKNATSEDVGKYSVKMDDLQSTATVSFESKYQNPLVDAFHLRRFLIACSEEV